MTVSTNSVKQATTKPVEYTDCDAQTLARVMRRSQEKEGKPVKRVAPLQRQSGFSLLK